MSWKSIVITGLLCVVASPVLAAPGLTVDLLRSGGVPVLDSDSNWQWVVSVSPDRGEAVTTGATGTPPNATGGSIATELGFTASGGSNLVSITPNLTNFPNLNPGAPIAGFPAGPGAVMAGNNAVAFLGSTFFEFASGAAGELAAPQQVAIIKTVGPSGNLVGGLTDTTLAWLGSYSGSARLAQNGENFNTGYSGSLTKTVLGGDANMDGDTNFLDFATLQNNYVPPGSYIWSQGDFNRDHEVDFLDFAILQNDYVTAPIPAPGGGSLGASAVPEPASVALALLAACAMSFFRGRNRN